LRPLPLLRVHPVMIVIDGVHLISRTEPIIKPDHSPAVDQHKLPICQANTTGISVDSERPAPSRRRAVASGSVGAAIRRGGSPEELCSFGIVQLSVIDRQSRA